MAWRGVALCRVVWRGVVWCVVLVFGVGAGVVWCGAALRWKLYQANTWGHGLLQKNIAWRSV